MNEYEVRKHVLSSDLKPNEKMVMFAILMKVNWETFEGPVSVSVLVEMTNSTTPTIKRILSQLTKKNWIERTSKYISKEKSTPALTKVKFDNIGIKNDTSIKNDTGIKVDTPPVSNLTPPGIKSDTLSGIKNDTHTITYNNNQFTNNNEETESDCFSEPDSISVEREDDNFWLYPSSIQDASQRLAAQSYVQAHYHRLSYSERQRYMFPELTKPIWNNPRTAG